VPHFEGPQCHQYRGKSIAALQPNISLMAAFGVKADAHTSATLLVIADYSASRPDIGFTRLAPITYSAFQL